MMIKMMEWDGVFIEQQPVKDQESFGLWRQSPKNKGSPNSSGREGRQASVAKIAFFLFFVGWLNYALVSWNLLSIIPLGLSGTQSRTNQLQVPGFLNPANKLKKMHEHLLDSSVLDTGYIMAILPYEQEQSLPVGDAELDSAHVFVHALHIQLMCFLISPKGVEFTSFKGLGASKLIFSM